MECLPLAVSCSSRASVRGCYAVCGGSQTKKRTSSAGEPERPLMWWYVFQGPRASLLGQYGTSQGGGISWTRTVGRSHRYEGPSPGRCLCGESASFRSASPAKGSCWVETLAAERSSSRAGP
jgi:hypothetical protein